jgi:hypothetical protein
MPEDRVRLVLTAVMFVTLFLPIHPDAGPVLNGIVFVILSNQPAAAWFIVLYYPFLILLNAYLAFSPGSKLKIVYRVLLLIYLPPKWLLTIENMTPENQVGYWAEPVVVSVAALVEIFLIVKGWLEKGKTPTQ